MNADDESSDEPTRAVETTLNLQSDFAASRSFLEALEHGLTLAEVAQDNDALARRLHTLKGTIASARMIQLAAAIAAIEARAADLPAEESAALCATVASWITTVSDTLRGGGL